jgi:hypothetical protein
MDQLHKVTKLALLNSFLSLNEDHAVFVRKDSVLVNLLAMPAKSVHHLIKGGEEVAKDSQQTERVGTCDGLALPHEEAAVRLSSQEDFFRLQTADSRVQEALGAALRHPHITLQSIKTVNHWMILKRL